MPGCPNLAGDGYCDDHRDQSPKARADRGRGSAASRGYGHRWRKLRKMKLHANPVCEDPFGIHAQRGEVEPAVDVDHIRPRSAGGADSLANLQALCHACHSRKTAKELGWTNG